VPFGAVSAFVDPSVQFGLQFSVAMPAAAGPVAALPPKAPTVTAPMPAPAPVAAAEEPAAGEGNRVVALDAFRKSDSRKK